MTGNLVCIWYKKGNKAERVILLLDHHELKHFWCLQADNRPVTFIGKIINAFLKTIQDFPEKCLLECALFTIGHFLRQPVYGLLISRP